MVFVFLKPLVFPAIDYACYGSFAVNTDPTLTSTLVTVVPSGRLANTSTVTSAELCLDLLRNVVSTDEALLGSGTYVGSHVAIVLASPSGGRSWTYGLVVDADHNALFVLCPLAKNPVRVEFQPTSLCVVDPLNMCLQVAADVSTANMRVGDIVSRHDSLSLAWANIGLSSKRNVSSHKHFLKAAALSVMPDEGSRIPCWNPVHGKPIWHSLGQVLDFSFYSEGGRTPPTDRPVLNSLAEELVDPNDNGPSTPVKQKRKARIKSPKPTSMKNVSFVDDQIELVDEALTVSEDDDGDILEQVAKRKKVLPLPSLDACHPASSLNFPANQRPSITASGANQLPEVSASGAPLEAGKDAKFDALLTAYHGSKGKSFKPTAAQQGVFNNISNGMCASGSPFESAQQWAEDLQCLTDLGLLWHPALCKGVYSFEFGRSIKIQEFLFGDWISVAKRAESLDMGDFSGKTSKPAQPTLTSVGDLISCLDKLIDVADCVYKPFVSSSIGRLRKFLTSQKSLWEPKGADGVTHLTRWTNNRLFALRLAFTSSSPTVLMDVLASLSARGTEFADCVEAVREARFTALERSGTSDKTGNPSRRQREPADGASKDKKLAFATLLKEIPRQAGKHVCFSNLSLKGCTAGETACIAKGRCHFVPASLSAAAKTAFVKAVGPLTAELA